MPCSTSSVSALLGRWTRTRGSAAASWPRHARKGRTRTIPRFPEVDVVTSVASGPADGGVAAPAHELSRVLTTLTRRSLAALVLFAAAFSGLAPTADAASQRNKHEVTNGDVSGPFEGRLTTPEDFTGGCETGFGVDGALTYEVAGEAAAGTLDLDGCFAWVGDGTGAWTGEFDMVTPDGKAVSGTYAFDVTVAGNTSSFEGALTPTKPKKVRGTINVQGTTEGASTTPPSASASGTLAGDLQD
jgi:hypothetical protein